MLSRRQTVFALLTFGAIAAVLLATDAASRALLLNSIALAAGTCAIAVPLGVLLAVVVSRTNVFGHRLAAAAIGLLLVLPLLTQLAGWDAFFGKLGWLSMESGSIAHPWLAGMRGAIWVHAMAATPWAALIISLGLLQVDPQLEEAALLEVSPLTVFLHVSLVRSWPFVFAAAAWTAICTTTEMTVTNIYLVNTYTEQIYNGFALNSDPLQVGWRLWPGIVLLGVLAAVVLIILQQLAEAWATAAYRPAIRFRLRRYRILLSALLWVALALLIAVPISSLVLKAGFVTHRDAEGQLEHGWSAARTAEVLTEAPLLFRYEFFWSLSGAAIAASAAVAIAIVLTWLAIAGGWRIGPLAVALTVGLAIPGPLIGVALIGLLNRESIPGFIYLYDRTIIPPALAQTIRALPIAVLICWPALASISRRTLDAAQLDGLGRWGQLRWIAIPQRRPALLAAWLLAAAVAFGDLSHSLLVVPPGMDTIQRRIFGLVHAGVDEQVAAASLLIIAGYAGVAGVSGWLFSRQSSAGSNPCDVY
jgi:iron(III) transport system permease protein